MNKQALVGVGVGLLVLAVLIFLFTRSSPSSESASLSGEMPKPRADSPTFAPDVQAQTGGRNSVGHAVSSKDAPPGTSTGQAP